MKKVKELPLLCGIVFAIAVSCLIGSGHLYDKFHITRFLSQAIIMVILFLCLVYNKKDILLPKTKIFSLNLIFVILAGCSMFWATNFSEALFSFSKIIMGFLTMILAYNILIIKQEKAYLGIMIACGIVLAVYISAGILQYLKITDNSFTALYEISGINGHKNLLSAMLFMLSSFLLTSLPFLKSKILKAIPIIVYLISLVFVVLLKSRATIIGYCVSIIVFAIIFLIRKKNITTTHRWKVAISVIVTVTVFFFISLALRQNISNIVEQNTQGTHTEYDILSASSMYERIAVWKNTYKLSDKHTILGCGLGNWKIDFPSVGTENLYRCDVWNINFVRPHNEFLGLLAECGYLIFIIYLTFLCFLIVYSFFKICKLKNIKDFIVGSVSLSILIGANIISFFDFPNERIEFIIWINIIIGILYVILTRNESIKLKHSNNFAFLALSIILVIIGGYRYIGEYYTYDMQREIKASNWPAIIKYSDKSISTLYNIDPMGYPIHWYQGHAMLMKGDARAIYSLRKAYRYAPYCKQNLNDLGFITYYKEHDITLAKFYLRESMRISPNFVNSGYNLIGILINERDYDGAQMVLDKMYTDEEKRDMLLRDAQFFAGDNLDSEIMKINYDYDTHLHLQQMIDSLRLQFVE